MRRGSLQPVLLAVALVMFVGVGLTPPAWAEGSGSGYGWQPEELNWFGISQRRINDTRADSGLKLLEPDGYLWSLANERGRDMLERDYLAHQTPEGLDAGAYMRKDGARYEQWTELRAEDKSDRPDDQVAWSVMEAFLNDSGSRAAIVGNFDRLGVALAQDSKRRVYVILLAKAAPPPAPPASTQSAAPAPRPSGSITDIIAAAALRYGVDPTYLIRVARCESGLNPRAYNPAGPYIGLFQFSPGTFAAYGGRDIYSAADQSDVAARMISRGLASHWPVCGRR